MDADFRVGTGCPPYLVMWEGNREEVYDCVGTACPPYLVWRIA